MPVISTKTEFTPSTSRVDHVNLLMFKSILGAILVVTGGRLVASVWSSPASVWISNLGWILTLVLVWGWNIYLIWHRREQM
jgi:hypothetical protein